MDLFDWSKAHYRPTDPDTSREAAEGLKLTEDSIECLEYFVRLYTKEGFNGAEYELRVAQALRAEGWPPEKAQRRAESLRRRLTDLERAGELEFHLDAKGKPLRRNGRNVYYLPEIC